MYWFGFIMIGFILDALWLTLDPPEYVEIYTQQHSSYFINMYLRQCTISTTFVYII